MNEFTFEGKEINVADINILYIDGDRESIEKFGLVVQRLTCRKLIAKTGMEGLDKFIEDKPDIVVMDLSLPDSTGFDIIEKIRELDGDVPIVVLSKTRNDVLTTNAQELGADRFLSKPIKPEILFIAISKIIKNVMIKKEMIAKNQFILALLDINPSYIAIFGKGGLQYLNQPFKKFLKVSSIEEFNLKYGQIRNLFVDKVNIPKDDSSFAEWSTKYASGDFGHMLHIHSPSSSEKLSFILTSVMIPSNDHEYMLTFTDITQLEKEKQHYQLLAEYDSLTKIYNRNKINKEMGKEITRVLRYGQSLSVLMIDVDHFKNVNDTFGHPVGDLVLIELSRLIQDKIRKTDVLGRYGGEEFIILMPSTPLEKAAFIADRIRSAISKVHFEGVGKVTCSIGVSEYFPQESVSDFIKRSDDALYLAKNNGRNRVEFIRKDS